MTATLYYHKLGSKIVQNQRFFIAARLDKLGRFSIENAILKLSDQETIEASGRINILKGVFTDKYSLMLFVKADQLGADFIKLFCKIGKLTKTKDWCLHSIKTGSLTHLKGSIYMEDIFSDSVILTAKAQFQNLNLKYSELFPQIDNLHGAITLDRNSLIFAIDGGKMLNTQLGNDSEIKVDLVDKELPVLIRTSAVGPIQDFVNFIPTESQQHLAKRKIKLSEVKGQTNAKIDIRIPLSKEVNLTNMTLNASANFSKFQLEVFESLKFEGDLILQIENHLLSLTGTPLINEEPANFKWETHLKSDQAFDNRMSMGFIPDQKKNLSLKGWAFVMGNSLPTQILYIGKGIEEQITINSNLTDVRVELPHIALIKEVGKQANFEMLLSKQKDFWKTKKCTFSSPEEESLINFYAEFDNDLSSIIKLNSDIQTKTNNLKVGLILAESEYKLQITGTSIVPSGDQLFQLLSPKSFSSSKKISVLYA